MSKPIQHVLIVDDNRLPRIMERTILTKHFPDLTVHDAGTDEEALSLVEQHAIDLALLDINMPGLGGIELAKKIQTDHPVQHLCFISANIQKSSVEQAGALGAHFIAKPISEEKLIKLIGQLNGA